MKRIIIGLSLLSSLSAFANEKNVCLNFNNLSNRPVQIELNNGNLSGEYFGPMTITLKDMTKTEHQTSLNDQNSDRRPESRVTTSYSRKLKFVNTDGSAGLIYLSFSRDGLVGAKNLDVQINNTSRISTNGSDALLGYQELELKIKMGACP